MPVQTAPCSWDLTFPCATTDPDDEEYTCEHLDELTPDARATIEEMATAFLWNWTARQFGACPVTIRPCRQNCWQGVSTYWGRGGVGSTLSTGIAGRPFTPVIINGGWYNIGCGTCGDSCGCGHTESLQLPGPIAAVTEVQIDGEVLPPSAYRVDNDRFLVRTDGGAWPTCQDMNAALGEENTWAVTYERGIPVPAGGQVAAGSLACELAKAACRDKSCGLPQRVQSVTRQGVTIAVLDAFDDIDTGHTGIWLIDSWVASVMKRPRPWRVYSPDRKPPVVGRIQTWP